MISCPECGLAANDEAKFCERCGQSLTRPAVAAAAIPALKPGTILKTGFEIVELLNQGSAENRYRIKRQVEGKTETMQLRERLAPRGAIQELSEADEIKPEPSVSPAPPEEDPKGPRAKTQELKMPASASQPVAESGTQQVEASAESPTADLCSESATLSDEPNGTSHSLASDHEPQPEDGRGAQAGTAEIVPQAAASDDLGELFGRVLALSLTINHPAFHRAVSGFAQNGRVYLMYPDESLVPLSRRPGGIKMSEAEAIALTLQVCQAVSVIHRRGLRVNDICPESIVVGSDGRVKLTGLDYVSNDTELQSEPIFNDGYTAPEIYKAKKVDKRADVFSVGALLYSCLTGERIDAETWREEAGSVSFYPPHVVSPLLEQAVRRSLAFNPQDRWPTVDAFKAELIKLNNTIRIRGAAITDVGMVRELNEDSVISVEYTRESQIEPGQHYLYLVADGMGGAAAGEVASAIAVGTVRDYVENRLSTGAVNDPGQLLKDALEEANRRILEHQAANPELRGMGSTAVSTLITSEVAAVAWVGDSRAYLSEGSTLRQLTKDHSLVQRLIEVGQLTPEQARTHEHKNVITRSLGARQNGPAGAESVPVRLKRGDRLVLCSDGLTTHVEDGRIAQIVRRHADPWEAGRELVVAANAGGGTDNISVVVIFVE